MLFTGIMGFFLRIFFLFLSLVCFFCVQVCADERVLQSSGQVQSSLPLQNSVERKETVSGSLSEQGLAIVWSDCVKEAIQNNPDLINAREKIKEAKAKKFSTMSALLPQVSSNVNWSRRSADTDAADTYGYGISGEQLIFDGFKTFYNTGSAAQEFQAMQYHYEVVSADVLLRLRTAFIEVLKAQELLRIARDIVQRRKQNIDLVSLRYDAGREHKGALLTAQANFAQAEFEISAAQRSLLLAQRRLAKELGRSHASPFIVQGDWSFPFSSQEQDFETLVKTNPALQKLISQRKAARLNVRAAYAEFFPEISTSASIGRSDVKWPPEKEEWSFGVAFSFPLFEGGRRIAEVAKARALLKQALADELSNQNEIIVMLEEAWVNFEDAVETVRVQKKFLEAVEERAKIAQAQYSNGLISFDTWIIIEDDLVNAKKLFLNVQAAGLLRQAEWIQAQGGTLEHNG